MSVIRKNHTHSLKYFTILYIKILWIFIAIAYLFSCSSHKSFLINNEWIIKTIYFNKTAEDTINVDRRIKFLKNGKVLENKYRLTNRYKVTGNEIHFIDVNTDSITIVYEIFILNDSTVIFEADYDSLKYKKLVLTKTTIDNNEPYDFLLFHLAELYDIGRTEILGDSTVFINFNAMNVSPNFEFIYDNPVIANRKIKGIIDRSLKTLPKKEDIEKFSRWCNCITNYYEWETLELIIKMQNNFENNSRNENYLNSRIWISKK